MDYLPQYTQMSNNIVGKVPCPREPVKLHSKLLVLNETRFKHWPSLAFMAYLRHTVGRMTLPLPVSDNPSAQRTSFKLEPAKLQSPLASTKQAGRLLRSTVNPLRQIKWMFR